METNTESWNPGRQLLLQRCKSRALICLNEHEFKRAFAHFIVALTVQPSLKGELLNAFLFTLEKLTSDMEKECQITEILSCYQQALDVLPYDAHVLHGLASTLFRMGYVECAASYFLKSYQANPFFTPSLYCMENLKNALIERWHFVMLNDIGRNKAYQNAIQKAVQAGYRCVLDVGAGTGIFSMIAVDAGAEKTYSCEGSEIMSAVLQNITETNNKRVQIIQKFSTELSVPEDLTEKVSLVVTEIFDAGLFGESSLETLYHAWEHLLVTETDCTIQSADTVDLNPDFSRSNETNDPGVNSNKCSQQNNNLLSKVIPYSATVFAVPVECERFQQSFRLNSEICNALCIKGTVIPRFTDEEPYTTDKLNAVPGGYKMLSEPAVLLEANFNSPVQIKSLIQGQKLPVTYTSSANGSVDAFVVWFELHLDDEISITTAPNSPESCCWDQAVFFVLPQCLKGSSSCNVGDEIEAVFACSGHLSLQNVNISNTKDNPVCSNSVILDPSLIYLLNSYGGCKLFELNLREIATVDNLSILDISSFPVFSLKALQENARVVTVLSTQYQDEVEQFQNMHKIPSDRLNFTSYEDLYQTKMQHDLLIVDPVEMCGLLKKNLLEDIMMLRMRCLKESGLVFPGEIEIFAILIESEALLQQSKVLSDKNTLGYKISQVMNAYKCQIHQDIEFSSLNHKKLSDPFKLCHIDLNSTSEQSKKLLLSSSHKITELEVTNAGRVDAVLYWFLLRYHEKCVVDTHAPYSLWKQAACIMDEEKYVSKGEKLPLHWNLRNGCLQITLSDHQSSVLF